MVKGDGVSKACQHERNLLCRPDTEAEAATWPAVNVRRFCADCHQFFVGGAWRKLKRESASKVDVPGGVATVTCRTHPGIDADLDLPPGMTFDDVVAKARADFELPGAEGPVDAA
jgi:hypothetical protein